MITVPDRTSYDNRNLTLLCDFYELTMANGYFCHEMTDTTAVFDYFFRRIPDDGGFAISAGLEQVIEYLENLKFTEEDLSYLTKRGMNAGFIDYLRHFEFKCDVWGIREGTPIFPGEPIIRVRGPIIQAQLIETSLLLTMNHQSLIATKASRIVRAAEGRTVMEFGSRRAHSYDAANYGARAAYIAGAALSANTWTDIHMGIPAGGTMAHSWVESFDNEFDSFKAYAETYPDNCVLLVDTYDTLHCGVPDAIKTAHEILEPMGKRLKGIRLDSGDIAYLTKKARSMLDDAGLGDCQICASNSLDERIIRSILDQGAKVDSFGVGENLITARSEAVFGGVYKLVAIYDEKGNLVPKMKVSDNIEKITTPSFKQVWRLFDKKDDHPFADVIMLDNETISDGKPYEIFDPLDTTKRKVVSDFYTRKLLEPIYLKGKLVYQCPDLSEIRNYCSVQVNNLWPEVRRFDNPHKYYVDLSQNLWDLKMNLLKTIRKYGD